MTDAGERAIRLSTLSSTVALVVAVLALLFFVRDIEGVSQAGVVAGSYGLLAALYIQFSPRLSFPLTLDTPVDEYIPITVYVVGAATVFHSISAAETPPFLGADPYLLIFANSMVVALTTGWLVYAYFESRN